MPRFSFSALFLAVCSLLPAMALELADLHLPLTRDEADKVLSRDYSFRVMQDMTVRRTWELKGGRSVSVDFSPKEGDKALLIFIEYARPVAASVSHDDAAKMLGTEPKWQAVNQKRALRLGMEAAEGLKLSGDRYCFRELNEEGKVLRLAYYAGMPSKNVRWELAEDVRDRGKTAMGARAAAGSTDFLWKDEERRRGVSAQSSASSLASAAAAAVGDGAADAAGETAKTPKMIERPKEPVDIVAKLMEYKDKLTPTHYGIAGAVVALLLLWRFIAHAREEKRRAMVANYIMNHGKIRTGAKGAGRKK